METKSVPLEVTDISHEKRTAVIAHAVYDNIDRVNDIARKGMFTKSWGEKKQGDGVYDISFYLNHNDEMSPGKVIRVFDDNTKAYTQIKAGTHTLGNDTLLMLDEGTIRNASFGYNTIKAALMKNGKNTRELKEVNHLETSVLTKLSANPQAGIVKVVKSWDGLAIDIKALKTEEQKFLSDTIAIHSDSLQKMVTFAGMLPPESDIYTTAQYWVSKMNDFVGDMKQSIRWNGTDSEGKPYYKSVDQQAELKAHIENLKRFCRNTKASDECIQEMETEIKSLELKLALNTADTQDSGPGGEPSVSEAEIKALSEEMLLLTFKHFV